MWFIISIFLLLSALSEALPPPSSLDIRQNRDASIKIQSVAMSGSACSSRTASVQLLADGRTFTVIYDKFFVHTGKGTTDNDYQKLCELRVKFTHTAGYAFNTFNVAHRGFANLERGDTALVDSNYGYSEESQEVRRKIKLNGPLKNDYLKEDNFTSTTTKWSPCGSSGEIIVTVEITLDAKDPKGSSQLTVDSTDFQFLPLASSPARRC